MYVLLLLLLFLLAFLVHFRFLGFCNAAGTLGGVAAG